MYYKYNKIFSYPQFNVKMIIGARGIGKTYGAKKFCIKKFINEGKRFLWLRDTSSAIKKLEDNKGQKFFADIRKNHYPDITGELTGGTIFINNLYAGYYMEASTFHNAKGTTYDDIDILVYDEFIPERSQRRNRFRVNQFLGVLETVCRTRKNVTVILLANALNRGDEILNLFNFKIDGYGYYFDKDKKTVLHYADDSKEYKVAHQNSIAGRIMKNTKFEDVIINNKFDEVIDDYYINLPQNLTLRGVLYSQGESVKIYNGGDYLYVTPDDGLSKSNHYVSKLDDLNKATKMIPKSFLSILRNLFTQKKIRYANANIKRIFYNFISCA